jgi:hypothetical protein
MMRGPRRPSARAAHERSGDPMLAVSLGGWAAIIAAAFWARLVAFLAIVCFRLASVLESTKMLIDDVRKETVPLLDGVTTTVGSVNQNLVDVDTALQSVGGIVKSADRVTTVVEQTVSSPLIKVIAFSAGAQRAVKKMQKDRKP